MGFSNCYNTFKIKKTMTPQYKEIIQLNRELGEALGHLKGILSYLKDEHYLPTKMDTEEFMEKVKNRKSFLED